MKRLLAAAGLASLTLIGAASAASAQTVKVMVMQVDGDATSLKAGNRIQNSILRVFQNTVRSPDYQRLMAQYNIQGFDVYNEAALGIQFPNYNRDNHRRSQQEVISFARNFTNPKLDVVITYSAYAEAVEDPYTGIAKLQGTLEYQALNMLDNQFLGGDRLTLNTAGVPFTGCAAGTGNNGQPSEECVKRFVSDNFDVLARDAANQMAIQLATPLGLAFGGHQQVIVPTQPTQPVQPSQPIIGNNQNGTGGQLAPRYPNPECRNLATNFSLTFEGFDNYRITAVEQFLSSWSCAFDVDIVQSNFSSATYDYKTSADQGRLVRNLRLMLDAMGVVGSVRTNGQNEIKVEILQTRSY